MRSEAIYIKTDAGRQEIQTRAHKLPPGLRSILLLVDGQREAGQLRLVAQKLHAPGDALERLADLGLIQEGAPVDGSAPAEAVPDDGDAGGSEVSRRYRALSGLMSEAVGQHLGLRGFLVQLKIERCSSLDELAQLLRGDLHAALSKAKGADFANRWVDGVQTAGLL